MIGTTVGRYAIEAVLGRGGMGEVYRARDSQLDRPVAVKVISTDQAESQSRIERFLREARAASALNHPHIVTIHEVGRTDTGQYYMVQELVEGQTLRAVLAQRIAIDRAVHFVRQLAKALAAAHAAGIVHRDIKPENIMIRPDGYLKVLDFGLARMVLPEADTAAATTTQEATAEGTLLGTCSYMSPEQARGQSAGSSSDVFSLGIVLYEMLAGRRPFVGDSTMATLNAIVTEHPVPPSRLNADVPLALDTLVSAMLSKDAVARPAAAALDARLDEAIGAAALSPIPRTVRHTVGRDLERSALLDAFHRSVAGQGLMVAVAGEPGIGKTSLVEDFLAEIVTGPHRPVVARGRCSERLAGAEAYLPILEVLDHLLHGQTVGGFSDIMKTLAPTWFVHVGTLGLESVASQQLREEMKTASPERMKRELAACFEGISRVRPLVLFLDDLHWADISTVDVLNYLAQRFAELRIFVVVTYRSSEMSLDKHPFLQVRQELLTRGTLKELALDFLSLNDVERYLALEFPGHALPQGFGRLIHEKTEGNPLFMVDLLRYLRDRGVIVRDERQDVWSLGQSMPDVARELPETVKSTIARKIDRLDETDRKLLTTASVQGYEFDTIVLSDVLAIDPADVEERIEVLDRVHRFVRHVATDETADKSLTVRYRFVHVLYQNVLYASLQPTRRASLSGKVAQSLEAHSGGDVGRASELALLFEAARDFTNAARSFLLAAQHQISLFAFREGVALAHRGLNALPGVKDERQRTQLEVGLQVALASCLRAVEGWAAPSVEKIYIRVREILEQAGDEHAAFPVRWGITLVQGVRMDLATWKGACEDNLGRAESLGNPLFVVAACQMLGAALEFLGETTEAAAMLERCAQTYEADRHQTYVDTFGLDPGMIGRSLWIRDLSILGRIDRARDVAEETIAIARWQRQPVSLAFALCLAQHVYILRRERDRLLEISAEMLDLCRTIGLVQEVEWGRTFQAWGLGDAGDREGAIAQLRDALARQIEISSYTGRGSFLSILAEQLLLAGRPEEGLAVVDEAFALRATTGESYFAADLLRWRGELLLARGDVAAAETSFREAIRVAARQKALFFELRAATALGRLLQRRGDLVDAQGVVGGVYGRLTEGFGVKDIQEAADLTEALANSYGPV
jgi:tRNA A-37 threonylcarbamoyl transferase component Bud32/tetratricopeptide (TPR) repeat protein